MKINPAEFFAAYRREFGPLNQSQVTGLNLLLGFIDNDPLPDARWIAYLLATIKYECADTWMPIEEYGKRAYFDKYEPSTRIGQALGNVQEEDGYLFRGRGYVQLTGRRNYTQMGNLLEMDLIRQPDLAKIPLNAYRIACVGMARGLFTGKALGDYINVSGCNYTEARCVVNGTDRAALIAEYAVKFQTILGGDTPREDDKTLAIKQAIMILQKVI